MFEVITPDSAGDTRAARTWMPLQKENYPEKNLHQLKYLQGIFVSLQNISYLWVSRFLTQRIHLSNRNRNVLQTILQKTDHSTKAVTQANRTLNKKINDLGGNPFSLLYHQVTTHQFTFQAALCNGSVLTSPNTELEFRTQPRHSGFGPSRPAMWVLLAMLHNLGWGSIKTHAGCPGASKGHNAAQAVLIMPVLLSWARTEPKLNTICAIDCPQRDPTSETFATSVACKGSQETPGPQPSRLVGNPTARWDVERL